MGVGVACTPSTGTAPSDDILRVVVASSPASMDPRAGTDPGSQRVHELIFDPLAALALRVDNPDPLTYIVHLRAGVRFHDGAELTSRDVVYTFHSGRSRQLAMARAADEYRVEFTLQKPDASFPRQLEMQVVPDGSGDALRTFPIGTGPYRFVRYVENTEVELSAFEGYWDGLPQNAGVILKVIPEPTMRAVALRDGSADLDGDRLTPEGFGTLKDVRKRHPYGAAFKGPSDRPN